MTNPSAASRGIRPLDRARRGPDSHPGTRPKPATDNDNTGDVRWALAGFGTGGRLFHAPMIDAAAGIHLDAVVTSSPERAQTAEARGVEVVGSLSGLADLTVEGVTITTPAGTHADLAHEALDMGLHVVVDKPFALTGIEAAEVVEHARRVGRVVTAYQNRRWDGDLLTIQELVASGALGTISRFESRLERFHPIGLPSWIVNNSPADGGGSLVDFGPHLIDQAVHLFGWVDTVSAQLCTFGTAAPAENDIRLELVHQSGMRSTIVGSLAAAAEGFRFLVNGDRGGAVIDGFDIQEVQLGEGGTPDTLGAEWGQEPAERTARVTIERHTENRPLRAGEWTSFYPTMARAVRLGTPPPVDPADSVHVCRIFDAARVSDREHRVVSLSENLTTEQQATS